MSETSWNGGERLTKLRQDTSTRRRHRGCAPTCLMNSPATDTRHSSGRPRARLPRIGALLAALSVLPWHATIRAEGAWVLWAHSYEVFVDANKDQHRRHVSWRRVTVLAAQSDCDDRKVREARAEFDTLTGKGVGATLTGSEVGFDQRNTRFKRGYRSFECWPDTVDPMRTKSK